MKKKKGGFFRKTVLFVFKLGLLALAIYIGVLAVIAWERFGSKKWELPARVYARALEIYPGFWLEKNTLELQLALMGYRRVDRIDAPGSFSISENVFTLHSRPFSFPDGWEPSRKIRVAIRNDRVDALSDIETGKRLSLVRLDPALIGSFYPESDQDRLWVKFDDAPPLLIQTIMAVEDKDFYDHFGIKPLSILRALKANILAGKTVQGGSTLTQQLVKNLFLSREKTLRRKFNEAIMALSLELFYDKDKIFEAYINEVYLAQDGPRAIHGFGMASRFYFGRSLEDLRAEEIALLTAMLKGPSYFSPRRHPERALKRRNRVLKIMANQKLIRPAEAERAIKTGLGVISDPRSGVSPFPYFMDLVKRRLLLEYEEEDIRTEGLRIFSTLDPRVQFAAENSTMGLLHELERRNGTPAGKLEAAVVITGVGNNEIAGIVGGRNPREPGFNRALDASRPIGSLIKPAIYLSALMRPKRYTLVTPLLDAPIQLKAGKDYWSPNNYDGLFHGKTPLLESLAFSYNAATVRLGLEIGLDKVFQTMRQLGIEKDFASYPSALLGAVELSPLETIRMYQTLAAGGYLSPIRAIQAVYRPDGEVLQRYPLTVRENIDPGAVYLVNKALKSVLTVGTGRSMDSGLVRKLAPAGKTGTTDDLRDSWFAGFTGDYAAVAWIGRDDNKPCGLTGASGALRLWSDVLAKISSLPLRLSMPENLIIADIDPSTGLRTNPDCPYSIQVPFIEGSEPLDFVPCRMQKTLLETETAEDRYDPFEKKPEEPKKSGASKIFDWFKGIFE